MRNAEDAFKMWHDFEPDNEIVFDVGSASLKDTFIKLGTMPDISYISDKWNKGKKITYEHKFGRQKPYLLAHPYEQLMIIVGGNWKITERGLVG